MNSETRFDLSTIKDYSNVVSVYKNAMKNAAKTDEGIYMLDNGYILNQKGEVLCFGVTTACTHKGPSDINYIISKLRQTPIDGKFHELFNVMECSSSRYAVSVMGYTIKDYIDFKVLRAKIEEFWANLERDYNEGILFRKSGVDQNLLANPNGYVELKFVLNFKYERFDQYVSNQFEKIVRTEFDNMNPKFSYDKLIFRYVPRERLIDVSIYIR